MCARVHVYRIYRPFMGRISNMYAYRVDNILFAMLVSFLYSFATGLENVHRHKMIFDGGHVL